MTTIEIFMKMVYWLIDNTEMQNQTEVARKAGLDPTNFTKIKNGTNKSVRQDTLRKLNNAFGKPFNPEWMRGKSDVMLIADLAPKAENADANIESAQAQTVDNSNLVKALLAAKDELIAALKNELAAKDDFIEAQREQVTTKAALVQTLQQQIADLQRMQSKP